MAAQGVRFFLQMGSTVVLARLLTPQDFGLIAMVAAVTGFVAMFKDMGLSMATVQKAEINHGQISTLFWINVVLSLCVMLVIAALAPAIAWFYNEPRLTWITLALAGAFIFGGLTVQHQALLRRQMHFGILAAVEITSMTVSILAAIISAFCGAGYWSLVIMQLAGAVTHTVAVWFACEWRPGLPVRRSGVREMLAFGGNLTGFNLMNYFARNADNLLIGKFWGPGQLGLYSKAYALLMLPLQQITGPVAAVAIPTLSRLQNDPERYRRYYYRAISMIAFITMPLVAMLAALSHEVITIVLGKQWTDSAIIFKVLAFAAIFQPIWSTIGWIYVSLGQTKRLMYWGLVMVPLIVISFLIGLPWGGLGVATSYTLCYLSLIMVPSFWYAFRYSPVSVTDLFRTIRCPLVLGLAMYCATELMRRFAAVDSLVLTVVYCCALGICVFALGLVVWPRARGEAFNVLRTGKLLRKPSTV
ncbi:MAG: lipopolysaccharide biosynthesis protein [Planctomycetes bacterium B3_Pla]|nr:MAG: lipopolysaccharide biosynthesis protein [Planctomycetes bacterium B3_Pla]